jgi:hypothetical protein
VQARLSERYDKLNIAVDFCAVEIYLHAFSAKLLDEDVPLTSNSDGYFPPVGIAVESRRDNRKGRIGQEINLSHNYSDRTAFVQPVG